MSKRMVMVIDQRRCIGCHTCVIACKSSNNVPDHHTFNRVFTEGGASPDTPSGTALGETCASVTPDVQMAYYTKACQHCETSPCVGVCPVDATWKRADGIVMMDPDKCTGCKLCMEACPYAHGKEEEMRIFYDNNISFSVSPVGDPNALPSKQLTVAKCTLCAHRLDNGKPTACAELCPGRARHIGNLNDPTSEVHHLIYLSGREVKYLPLGSGSPSNTEPSVYILKP